MDNRFKPETDVLLRQIAQLQGVEQRCLQAEKELQTIEARNRLLGDSAPMGILIIDFHSNITGMNRKMQEMSPWLSRKERKSANFCDGETKVPSEILADIQQCIFQQKSQVIEHSYSDEQRVCTHLRYYLSPVPGLDGPGTEVMAFVEDCTDLKKTEQALKESEQRYRRLYQSSPIALIERDVTELNSHLEHLRASGVSNLREYLEQNPSQIFHCWSLIKTIDNNLAFLKLMDLENCPIPAGSIPQTDSDVFREMAREIILSIAQRNKVSQRELAVVTASGQEKFVLGKSMVISGSEESLERVVVALVDISIRKKAEETLRESELRFKNQSLRDNLTGLFNQRYLYQSLAELIESAESNDTQISLIFMDLDHFKRVVDTHGHLNGSRAIREVARTINGCLEEPAYAVAYAGDEFVVVLPGYDKEQAFQKASEIRARMKETEYVLDQGIEVRLQASFGIATFPENAADLNALIAAADQALFAIKETGKNDIGVYPMHESLDQWSS
ncbi:MAG: sensor domain-containing diguanylate cyclase [Proteobacteria bacterium]|nr:sensor domain-containing diguanylate cyclase [Pseudomonadota bacterium]MBU1059552.1 sensor domain-containing diguanylate cyclase [Pseudomonadota bacterium]